MLKISVLEDILVNPKGDTHQALHVGYQRESYFCKKLVMALLKL